MNQYRFNQCVRKCTCTQVYARMFFAYTLGKRVLKCTQL